MDDQNILVVYSYRKPVMNLVNAVSFMHCLCPDFTAVYYPGLSTENVMQSEALSWYVQFRATVPVLRSRGRYRM